MSQARPIGPQERSQRNSIAKELISVYGPPLQFIVGAFTEQADVLVTQNGVVVGTQVLDAGTGPLLTN